MKNPLTDGKFLISLMEIFPMHFFLVEYLYEWKILGAGKFLLRGIINLSQKNGIFYHQYDVAISFILMKIHSFEICGTTEKKNIIIIRL